MPERRGRRHRNRDRRQRVTGEDAAAQPQPPTAQTTPVAAKAPTRGAQTNDGALPSRNARMSGFVIALVTAFLAILLIADAASGDHSSAETAIRAIAGVALVALAAFVAALVLFPAQIRDFLQRRYDRRHAR